MSLKVHFSEDSFSILDAIASRWTFSSTTDFLLLFLPNCRIMLATCCTPHSRNLSVINEVNFSSDTSFSDTISSISRSNRELALLDELSVIFPLSPILCVAMFLTTPSLSERVFLMVIAGTIIRLLGTPTTHVPLVLLVALGESVLSAVSEMACNPLLSAVQEVPLLL